MVEAYFQGIVIGAGLICAIGAQSTFILVQAVRRNHALAVAITCATLDLILITAGVFGMGALVAQNPLLEVIAFAGGAIFLFVFGWTNLRKIHSTEVINADIAGKKETLRKVLLTTIAISLLNPHVYLDTVVMLGMISTTYAENRYAFGFGACTASFLWCCGLGIAGQSLSHLFKKAITWRILYIVVCITVWIIAIALIYQLFSRVLPAYSQLTS